MVDGDEGVLLVEVGDDVGNSGGKADDTGSCGGFGVFGGGIWRRILRTTDEE